jgi:hypothetical protein
MGLLDFLGGNAEAAPAVAQPQPQFNGFGEFLKSPQALAMAAALLKGGAYSNRPISMGESLGEGINAMRQAGMQDLQKQMLQSALQQQKMQMQQMQNKQLAGKRIADVIGKPGTTPERAGIIFPSEYYQGSGVLGGKVPIQQAQMDIAKIYAENGDPDKAMTALSGLQKQMFKVKDRTGSERIVDSSGKVVYDGGANNSDSNAIASNPDLAKAMAKVDAKTVEDSRTAALQANQLLASVNRFDGILQSTPRSLLGPNVARFGINRTLSPNVQQLEQSGNEIALLARTLLKLPASGFSDADRDFLVKISLNTETSKDALQSNIYRLRELAGKTIQQNQVYENALQKSGNLSGVTQNIISQQSKNPQQQAQANQGVRRYNPTTGRIE